MEKKEFDIICRAIEEGEEKYIENLDTHDSGRVVACRGERMEVEFGGRRESWHRQRCSETMGSRFGHREKKLDKPPWDIDRFNPYI